MKRRVERTIRSDVADMLRFSHRWHTDSSEPLTAKQTVGQDPHSGRWQWRVDLSIGRPNPGMYEGGRWWNPGPGRYRGVANDATEANERAREVIDFARSVHAELVTTIAPPVTTTVTL